jgi:uncharacterized protein (TIGR03663 family)
MTWCDSQTTTDGPPTVTTPEPSGADRRLDFLFFVSLAAIVAVGVWLRVEHLTLKPLHHDESVNGWFTLRLSWWNVYKYRPADYHGPLLYYINLFFFKLLGPGEFALRLGTVIAGSSLPIAVLVFRRYLGRVGCLVAATLLALSPDIVYFSRTNIHEIYLLLFTILFVGMATRYLEEPSHRLGVLTAVVCALSFATKETTVISGACIVGGAALALVAGRPHPSDLFGTKSGRDVLTTAFRGNRRTWIHGSIAFGVITLLLFSSFFTYWYGIGGFFQAFVEWFKHGVGGRNQSKSYDYFVTVLQWAMLWLPYAAAPVALLAIVARRRIGLFLLGWTILAGIAYSLIPYKTPWCSLNIELPLILLLAWGSHEAMEVVSDRSLHIAARLVALIAVPIPLAAAPAMVGQVRDVSADTYDDDDVPYVFVQTKRGVFECVDWLLDVERYRPGRIDDQGPRVVNLGAKNPIRWYTLTRGWDYHRTEYVSDEVTAEQVKDADVVIATSKDHTMVEAVVEDDGEWHLERCKLRPGHRVSVWWREAHWQAFEEAKGDSLERGATSWPQRQGPPPPGPVFVPRKP